MMVLDDILGVLIGGSISSLGNRIASRFVKTPQEEAYAEMVSVQRQRLSSDMNNFRLKLDQDNRIFEKRIEHETIIFNKRVEENIKSRNHDFSKQQSFIDYQSSIKNWPLSTLPHEIRHRSRYHNSTIANLIICSKSQNITSENESGKAKNKRNIANLGELYNWVSDNYTRSNSSHQALPYFKVLSGDRSWYSHEVSTALHTQLGYTPTIFIYLDLHTNAGARIEIELWGMDQNAADANLVISEARTAPPSIKEIINIENTLENQSYSDIETHSLIIKSLIASTIDTAHLLCNLDEPPAPIAPKLLNQEYPEAGGKLPSLLTPYDALFAPVSNRSPLMGADLAMDVCRKLQAHDTNDLAKHYFILARQFIAKHAKIDISDTLWHDISVLKPIAHTIYDKSIIIRIKNLRNAFPDLPQKQDLDLTDYSQKNDRKHAIINKSEIGKI